MTRVKENIDAILLLIGALVIVATGVFVLIDDNRENQQQYDKGYSAGAYDGAHDLCQEVGGVWRGKRDGWCDMPSSS